MASTEDRASVAAKAKALQAAHTERRDTLVEIERRLSTARTRAKSETWLFVDLRAKHDLIAEAPARFDLDQKRGWAEQRYNLDLTGRYDAITARLLPGSSIKANFSGGELSISIDGVRVIERIFVGAAEGEFIIAQWKVLAATLPISEKTDGKKLTNALRKLRVPDNPAVVQQIIALEGKLSALEVDIERRETEMNALVEWLYGLTDAEILLVGKRTRRNPIV